LVVAVCTGLNPAVGFTAILSASMAHRRITLWPAGGWRMLRRRALPAGRALPDYDDDLARAIARGRVVTGFGLLAAANGRQPAIKAGFALLGADPLAQIPQFQGAVVNLARLEQAAAGNGSFQHSRRAGSEHAPPAAGARLRGAAGAIPGAGGAARRPGTGYPRAARRSRQPHAAAR
jgi:hypothetical protein